MGLDFEKFDEIITNYIDLVPAWTIFFVFLIFLGKVMGGGQVFFQNIYVFLKSHGCGSG